MDKKTPEQHIVESYQNDEKMMILIYAQWCINNDLDPKEIYKKAYPTQVKNTALAEAMELTVSKAESDDIPDETVINVLQLFGNDDLAFLVQAEIDKRAG